MDLTPGERLALENLSRKAKGEDVDWINIADARELAEKGLCDRDRQGWRINPQGLAWLLCAKVEPLERSDSAPIQLRP
jgi:hypothetical protein